ncbi:MAG TPA: FAD-dependent oxidoreductase [Acidimicrobiia bacterium]|nr:FAD-dependent oxidoreductase [Acidimicrobiia bacterium]
MAGLYDPEVEASVVVIGGGIIGSSVAYHLADMGVEGIVLLEKGSLGDNDGSTSHAPGGLRTLTVSKFFTKLGIASRELYDRLPLAEPGQEQFFRTGFLQVASTAARFDSYKRIQEIGWSLGVPSQLLSSEEAAAMIPLLDPSVVVGGMFSPTSGVIKTSLVATSMQQVAASTGRAAFYAGTEVTDVVVERGRVRGVRTSNPEIEEIECQQVVLCTNIWAPLLASKVGIKMPLFPGEHQYIFTTPVPALADRSDREVTMPICTIDDISVYFRQHHARLGIGSYHHEARLVDPWALPERAQLAFTPRDFDEAWTLMRKHLPDLELVEVDSGFNGMFAFTADHYPILGPSPIKGLWSAVGAWLSYGSEVGRVMARWITEGDPGMDIAVADINRFHDHQSNHSFLSRQSKYFYEIGFDILHPNEVASSVRDLRLAPYHDRTEALGAVYVPFASYETPYYYEANAPLVEEFSDRIPRRHGYDATAWSPIIGAEHLALRQWAGLIDWSASIGPVEISGPGSLSYLQHLCTSNIDIAVGSATYTLILTWRGTVKRDVTVARLGEDRFWLLTGKSNLPAELAYYRSYAPADGSITIVDRSEQFAAVGLWGPEARNILQPVTNADLSSQAFPWYSVREIGVGMAPAIALRVSYVGELGWEIYVPLSFGRHLWDTIWNAGREHGLRAVGIASLFSLRIEKGYRLIGSDLTTEITPRQAQMSWLLDGKKDFLGREGAWADGHRLVTLRFDELDALMHSWSPIFHSDDVIGWIASSEFGYSVGAYLAHAYVPEELAVPRTRLRVRYTGRFFEGEVVKGPLWDPASTRLKA